jgi:hypothetical protein
VSHSVVLATTVERLSFFDGDGVPQSFLVLGSEVELVGVGAEIIADDAIQFGIEDERVHTAALRPTGIHAAGTFDEKHTPPVSIDELQITGVSHAIELGMSKPFEPCNILGCQGHHGANTARVTAVVKTGVSNFHGFIVTGELQIGD